MKKILRLFSALLCFAILFALLSGCNTDADTKKDDDADQASDLGAESTDGETTHATKAPETDPPAVDRTTKIYADVNWDGTEDIIVIDEAAAEDKFNERKTVWVIDGLNEEELWSTTLGAASKEKGEVYITYNSQGKPSHLYIWRSYLAEEKVFAFESYEVFVSMGGRVVPARPSYCLVDFSSEQTMMREGMVFSQRVKWTNSVICNGGTFTLLNNTGETIKYSNPYEAKRPWLLNENIYDWVKDYM